MSVWDDEAFRTHVRDVCYFELTAKHAEMMKRVEALEPETDIWVFYQREAPNWGDLFVGLEYLFADWTAQFSMLAVKEGREPIIFGSMEVRALHDVWKNEAHLEAAAWRTEHAEKS